MKTANWFIPVIIIILVIVAFIFWKGGDVSSRTYQEGEYPGTLKVGHLVALDMAPLFIAKEAGYFEEEGLDVDLVFFSNPGDNNAALAGEKIQYHINPFTLPYLGENSGVPMRIISSAGGLEIIEVVIQGEYGVESMSQLATYVKKNPTKKLKVGSLQGDTLDMILYKSFGAQGLTYDDFEMVWFSDLLAMVDSFKSGKVDVLSHIKPYTTDLQFNYDAKVLTNNDKVWGEGTPNTTIVALEDFIEKYPVTTKKFLRSIYRGFDFALKNPEEATKLLAEGNYFKTPEEVLLHALKNSPRKVLLHPNVNGMMTAIKDMVKQNYIQPTKVNIVRTEILDEVVKEFK